MFWYKVALPSSFPFFSMYYYNLVQVLIALFVCMEVVYRERKKGRDGSIPVPTVSEQ